MAGVIVADASVLIAWLDDCDVHYASAIEVLSGVDRFVVDPLTLAEVLVHPARHGRDGEVIARLEAIGMTVSTLPLDARRLAHMRAGSGLRMPDCVVLVCAAAHGLPVATFDERLRAEADRPR